MLDLLAADGLLTLAASLGANTTDGTHGPGEALTTLWSAQAMMALATLTLLEIVLGVDNIVFISILSKKLPASQSDNARRLGLGLAMGIRILLLLSISWVMSLTAPVPGFGFAQAILGDAKPFNWRDVILLLGGLFLIYKATVEIHHKLEGDEAHGAAGAGAKAPSFWSVIFQILLLDIVFSLDSVITAVGMVQSAPGAERVGLTVMIVAIVIAVLVMLFASGAIASFVERHPTVKMLALSFLILIGVILVVDATHRHVPKGYIYFAMAFALGVEMLNLKLRKPGTPVHLKNVPPAGTGDVTAPAA